MMNIEKIKNRVRESGMDAVMLLSPANRLYATGFQSSAGVVIVTAEQCFFMTDFRYIEAANERIQGAEIIMVESGKKYTALINEIAARCGIESLGFEDGFLSVSQWEKYTEELKPQLKPLGDMVSKLRAAKSEAEIEKMIKAQRISESALDEVLGIIKPGLSEKEIAAELVYRMLRGGAQNVSFDPIVVSGVNSSMPHGVPGEKKIEPGDFITMDFGCIYEGYCSDMTRTVAVGHATDEMKKVYDTVLQAQLAGIAVTKAGVPGAEIDAAARKVITDAGYGDYFGHSYGHSLGIEIHETPNAAPSDQTPLPAGAVVSAEPGIYIPGKFGVRIEDVVVIRENGCENITKAKKELIIL